MFESNVFDFFSEDDIRNGNAILIHLLTSF